MKSKRVLLFRGVAALLVAGGLAAASVPAMSQPGNDDGAATRHERIRKHINNRLDRMAAALQITPAQQAAWTQYRNAIEAQVGAPPALPAKDADPATLVRWRAERAAEFARKLGVVADATATLQSALTAEQRKTLGDLIRYEGRAGHHHRGAEARPTAM